ncbi:MAG: matrixin family metalloprotease [bacterium]|nr:matrixin family metalloprotease [bacterium]
MKKYNKKLVTIGIISTCMITNIAMAYNIKYSNGYNNIPAYVVGYSGFSNETTQAIHNSCLAWNIVHDGDLVYRSTSTHSRTGTAVKNGVNEITKYNLGTNSYIMVTGIYNPAFKLNDISEADITINISYPFGSASTSFDTQSAITHEIGHLLGLGHSSVTAACMYETIDPGTIKGVHTDDINGINSIY